MGLFSKVKDLLGSSLRERELERKELEQLRERTERAAAGTEGGVPTPIGPKLRRRYVFVGTVQGVGFRWTMTNLATSAGATGWVRNERDGSVTAEVQGVEEQIEAVIEGLDRYYNGRRLSFGGFQIAQVEDADVLPDEQVFEPTY